MAANTPALPTNNYPSRGAMLTIENGFDAISKSWQGRGFYEEGSIAIYDNRVFVVTQDIPAPAYADPDNTNPAESDLWIPVSINSTGISLWAPSETYLIRQIVTHDGVMYINLTGSSTTDTPADDTTNWEPVQKQADWFETNVDHKGYIKNIPINFGDELRKTDRFNGIEGNVEDLGLLDPRAGLPHITSVTDLRWGSTILGDNNNLTLTEEDPKTYQVSGDLGSGQTFSADIIVRRTSTDNNRVEFVLENVGVTSGGGTVFSPTPNTNVQFDFSAKFDSWMSVQKTPVADNDVITLGTLQDALPEEVIMQEDVQVVGGQLIIGDTVYSAADASAAVESAYTIDRQTLTQDGEDVTLLSRSVAVDNSVLVFRNGVLLSAGLDYRIFSDSEVETSKITENDSEIVGGVVLLNKSWTNDNVTFVKDGYHENLSPNAPVLDATGNQHVLARSVNSDGQFRPTALAVNSLRDVDTDTITPIEGEGLIWNDSDKLWQPGLSHTTINIQDKTTLKPGSVAVFDGTEWQVSNTLLATTLISAGFLVLTQGVTSGNRTAYEGSVLGEPSTTYWYDNTESAWYDAEVDGNLIIRYP